MASKTGRASPRNIALNAAVEHFSARNDEGRGELGVSRNHFIHRRAARNSRRASGLCKAASIALEHVLSFIKIEASNEKIMA